MKQRAVLVVFWLITANFIFAQEINTSTNGDDNSTKPNILSDVRNSKAVYSSKAYAINGSDQTLESIDLANGAGTVISSVPASVAPIALAFIDSTLFCLSVNSNMDIVAPDGSFSTSGTITGIPPIMTGTIPVGLAYDFTTGFTYLTTIDVINNISSLYSLNMSTLVATFIGNIINKQLYSIEIDDNGNMFAICTTNDSLYQVDMGTGLGTPLGAIGIPLDDKSQDMAWSFANSALFAIFYDELGNGSFGMIDTTTGVFTEIADYAAKQYSGFAINKNYVPTTGNNESSIGDFLVFPNPAKDFITIQNFDQISFSVSMYNDTGVLVLQQIINGTESICISELSSGLYIIVVSGDHLNKTSKLLIE